MKIVKVENRTINVGQIAHTEYRPAKQTDVKRRVTTDPSSTKPQLSVSTPSQYLIVFSSGAELKLTGIEAENVMNAIEHVSLGS